MRHHIGKKVRSGDRRIDAACSGKDKSRQPIPGLGVEGTIGFHHVGMKQLPPDRKKTPTTPTTTTAQTPINPIRQFNLS